MAFTQSFSLGENTLNQLDVCDMNARSNGKKANKEFRSPPKKPNNSNIKCVIDKIKTPEIPSQQPLEVINESPTEKSDIFCQSIAERLKNVTSSKKSNRKHFRRSKSDPVTNNKSAETSSMYRQHGLTEDFGSMFDSTMELNECSKMEPKSKSKLIDKFDDDDEFDHLFNGIETQPIKKKDNSSSSVETGIMELNDSSGMENVNLSEIEKLLKTSELNDGKQDDKQEGSFNIFSQDVKSQLENAIQWENSAFFNEFIVSQSVAVVEKIDTVEEAIIDADCSFSAASMTSFVEDEMKSCFLQLTNELSKMENPVNRLTQNIPLETSSISNKISFENEPVRSSITQTKIRNESISCKLDIRNLSEWGCSGSIIREYTKKGIQKMFEWQAECLSIPKVIFKFRCCHVIDFNHKFQIKNEHKNLVYSAPTSAGKTFVSEILMFKTVLQRKKQVLFILPFISVVREKMYYLQVGEAIIIESKK